MRQISGIEPVHSMGPEVVIMGIDGHVLAMYKDWSFREGSESVGLYTK